MISNYINVKLESITYTMLKYYWNQLFFFNLKQSPNNEKTLGINNNYVDKFYNECRL